MKVFVYFNLHKKLWSIKALEGERKGKVIGHQSYIALAHARPKVSEAGRKRVLKEKCKNVHAGIVGYMSEDLVEMLFDNLDLEPDHVTYNPYEHDSFYYTNSKYCNWKLSPVVLMNADAIDKVMVFDEVDV